MERPESSVRPHADDTAGQLDLLTVRDEDDDVEELPSLIPAVFSDSMSVADARALVMRLRDDGVGCPCCDQFAKVYKRKIHSRMAADLIRLYRAGAAEKWVHLPTVLGINGGDTGKLRYWGLIEEEAFVRRDDGGRAGWWRVTALGVAWVEQRVTVAKYAYIYDNHLLRVEGDSVAIADALGTRFRYDDLMAGV